MLTKDVNKLIAEKVLGKQLEWSQEWEFSDAPSRLQLVVRLSKDKALYCQYGDWNPLGCIECAWQLFEYVAHKDGYDAEIYTSSETKKYVCMIYRYKSDGCTDELWQVWDDLAPRAISLAALKSVGITLDEENNVV